MALLDRLSAYKQHTPVMREGNRNDVQIAHLGQSKQASKDLLLTGMLSALLCSCHISSIRTLLGDQ